MPSRACPLCGDPVPVSAGESLPVHDHMWAHAIDQTRLPERVIAECRTEMAEWRRLADAHPDPLDAWRLIENTLAGISCFKETP